MVQKCSYLKVLEVFFQEPTSIQFIKSISRKINLAPTSVKNHVNQLIIDKLIIPKESIPFNGFIANRDNEKFIHYKRSYNLFSLFELNQFIISELYPKKIILFGSYSIGEDVESSDIDLIIISKANKEFKLDKFEKELKRKINIMIINKLDKLDNIIKNKVNEGIILYG